MLQEWDLPTPGGIHILLYNIHTCTLQTLNQIAHNAWILENVLRFLRRSNWMKYKVLINRIEKLCSATTKIWWREHFLKKIYKYFHNFKSIYKVVKLFILLWIPLQFSIINWWKFFIAVSLLKLRDFIPTLFLIVNFSQFILWKKVLCIFKNVS